MPSTDKSMPVTLDRHTRTPLYVTVTAVGIAVVATSGLVMDRHEALAKIDNTQQAVVAANVRIDQLEARVLDRLVDLKANQQNVEKRLDWMVRALLVMQRNMGIRSQPLPLDDDDE